MESLMATGAGGAAGAVAAAAVGGLVAAAAFAVAPRKGNHPTNAPPAVPGLPIIGNLHQVNEKKPHHTFAKWSETYGPIYTLRTGASPVVVLNSSEIAKEAMIEKYSSISNRKLSKALSVLSRGKSMVAITDYGDLYKSMKRNIMLSMLGFSAQKQFRNTRDTMVNNMLSSFHKSVTDDPHAPLNFRNVFRDELFRLSLIQSLGEDVDSIYVDEFGRDISKEEIYNATVGDMMMCALEVDWRDFFPYLSWVPNKSFETKVFAAEARRTAVMRALIKKQKERIARGEARVSYLDFLLEQKELTDEQVWMLVWETIIEAADTTLVSSEWAMYEIAKNPDKQERLYQEIREVCGHEAVVTEEHLPRLPYLNAVFQETLRRHSPVPMLPPRLIHEDTRLAGYDVPAGTEVLINVYACNMDREEWDSPEEWLPERFLDDGGDGRGSSFGTPAATGRYRTMAFGAGKRSCAGSRQATTIACVAVARFVQEFGWRLREGDEDKVDTVQFTAYKLHPLQVHLTPRGSK